MFKMPKKQQNILHCKSTLIPETQLVRAVAFGGHFSKYRTLANFGDTRFENREAHFDLRAAKSKSTIEYLKNEKYSQINQKQDLLLHGNGEKALLPL